MWSISPPYWYVILYYSEAKYSQKSGLEGQEKVRSWWPTQRTWEKSSIYVGHWTAHCEHWYQQRLQEIREGNAALLSQSMWARKLRFDGPISKTILGQLDTLSRDFLQEHIVTVVDW